jgi:hypothetical protein
MKLALRAISAATTLALALALSTQAAAAIMKAEYTGKFWGFESFDDAGYFGVGTDLTEVPFNVTFVYDTSISDASVPGIYDQNLGGSLFGGPSPIISASIKVNNITRSFESDYVGYVLINRLGGFALHQSSKIQGEDAIYITAFPIGDLPTSLTSPYSSDISCAVATLCGGFVFRGGRNQIVSGNFNPSHITITAVPEPTTWALMIGGFGLAGAALRRQRELAS